MKESQIIVHDKYISNSEEEKKRIIIKNIVRLLVKEYKKKVKNL